MIKSQTLQNVDDKKISNYSIKFLSEDHRFIIYRGNKILGGFTISQIIKYLTNNISNIFLNNIEYESSVDLIEKYICKYNNNKITLVSHLESPLMGNIEIMMKIYHEINYFDVNILTKEIDDAEIDIKIKNMIINNMNELTYLILNQSLKIIVNISDIIKNDTKKLDLKNSLIKYSIFITNKINNLLHEKFIQKIKDYQLIEIELEQLKKLKDNTNKKINNIEFMIEKQNLKIQKIIDFIDLDDIENMIDSGVNRELNVNRESDDNDETSNNKESDDNGKSSNNKESDDNGETDNNNDSILRLNNMDNIYDMIISDTHDNKNIRGIKNILDVDNLDYNLYDGDENYKDDDYSYKGVSKLKSNIAYLSE
jgi:hypothetical protein